MGLRTCAAPRPSAGLIAVWAMKNGPSPVNRSPMISSRWLLFNVVLAVFTVDRPERFTVDLCESMENGAPDCQNMVPPSVQPPIKRPNGR